LAGHARTADDEVERDEDVLALDRSVLKRDVEREVPPPDRDPRRAARNQRAGNADIGRVAARAINGLPGRARLCAQQPLRIKQAEGEPDYRRDGCERDVALGEVEPDADDLAALPATAAHDARVGNGCGIGAGSRTGEREAGDLLAAREPREVLGL